MEGWAECSGAWEDEWASAPLSPRHRALSEGDAAEYKITLLPFPTRSAKLWVVCYLSKVTVGSKLLAAREAERRPQSLTAWCWIGQISPPRCSSSTRPNSRRRRFQSVMMNNHVPLWTERWEVSKWEAASQSYTEKKPQKKTRKLRQLKKSHAMW